MRQWFAPSYNTGDQSSVSVNLSSSCGLGFDFVADSHNNYIGKTKAVPSGNHHINCAYLLGLPRRYRHGKVYTDIKVEFA